MFTTTRAVVLLSVVLTLSSSPGVTAVTSHDVADSTLQDCNRCHTCAIPRVHQECLKDVAVRRAMVHQIAVHEAAEAPDSLLLDPLVHDFAPVCFNHKLHAEMSGMSGKCSTCHHFSPEGKIPPCRDCHATTITAGTEGVPLLGEAYHRQCRSCHESWSHNQSCAPCHESYRRGEMSRTPESLRYAGEAVQVPVSRVYKTARDSASFVTFQHIEHIELFQFECTDCHRQETCKRCHEVCQAAKPDNSGQMASMICVCCHRVGDQLSTDETCIKCHDVTEHPPRFHEIIGESLPAYLEKGDCQNCHKKRM